MERAIPAPDDERQFVESLGGLAEAAGMPRMAGRVLGALLLADGGRRSFAALVIELGASKGSISATTRLLISMGLIERVSQAGDRRDYFRLCDDAWTRFLEHRVGSMMDFRDAAGRGLELLHDAPPERRARLQAMYDFYTWWGAESSALLSQWRRR